MNKVAHYLQEHVSGEVLTSNDARKHFSTDCSIFNVVPAVVMYPRSENDVRKTARFSWQLAERGRIIPITPRGCGLDTSGGAIGSGIVMVFPAHLDGISDYDSKKAEVTVEPGVTSHKLQQALEAQGRFIPAAAYSGGQDTVGGMLACNTSGAYSYKYGDFRKAAKRLKVVLANGEIIETCRLSKRELDKKLGLATFEGEIYRALDKLLEESEETINQYRPAVDNISSGYDLWDVKKPGGSFDLTPLFVGSQGTLGIITEAILDTMPYNPETTLLAAFFDDLQVAEQVLAEINELGDKPASIELISGGALGFLEAHNPNLLKDVLEKPLPKLVMIMEFDDSARVQKKTIRKTAKILSKNEVAHKTASDAGDKEGLLKLLDSAAYLGAYSDGEAKATPVIGGGSVPLDKFKDFLEGVEALLKKNSVTPAVWGSAGGQLISRPCLDLSQVGDRQKAFKLADEYNKLVISLGGSLGCGENDGRLRAPYLKQQYGEEIYSLFEKVKDIFDPYKILNPGVKTGVTLEDTKPLLRYEYSLDYLYNRLSGQ